VATRCPKCAEPPGFAAEEVGEAGRFVRCSRCGTSWLARRYPADVFSRGSRRVPMLSRKPPIIEGEILPPLDPGQASSARTINPPIADIGPIPAAGRKAAARLVPAPVARRSGRRLIAVGLALSLLVVGGLAIPIAGAIPGVADLFATRQGLDFEQVKSASLRRGGSETLLVQGQLVNHGSHEVAVPAIRISLRTASGNEVYSWLVEPAATRLAAGQSLEFRSALTNPVPGAEDVALSFADRSVITVGLR